MIVSELPTDLSAITAQWLTERFRAAGRLTTERVISLCLDPNVRWNVAETAFVELRFDSEPRQAIPRYLFAKVTRHRNPLEALLPGEYAFYTSTVAGDLPVPQCHLALRGERSGGTLLLLEDLRATHEGVEWPLPPTLDRCEGALRALASLHAATWSGGDAGSTTVEPDPCTRERRLAEHVEGLLPGFLDHMGDRLSDERRGTLETALSHALPLKLRRLSSGRPLCLIHGDAHFWNVLYPRKGAREGCRLIDWEDWRYDFAASDLALMMAMHWYPERRSRHEKALLARYREALETAGVTGYGDDALAVDYRLAHLCNVVVPLLQYEVGHAHASWWSNLERWFLAYDDLDCRSLL